MTMITSILTGTAIMVGIGGVIGFLLAFASQRLKVEKDRLLLELEEVLPGLNCGGCGYSGCSAFAEALADKSCEDVTLCKPGGEDLPRKLGSLLSIAVEEGAGKKVAVVCCGGGSTQAKNDFEYSGMEDCVAASLFFGGKKGCKHGCVGLGSCVKICPVNAITINIEGIAVIDENLCISCEKCVGTCPSSVIKMLPEKRSHQILCNSKDTGKITKSNCSVGCIGCKICVKKFSELGFMVNDYCASVDYATIQENSEANVGDAVQSCPAKCITAKKQQG